MHRYAIFSALFAPHMGGVEAFTANLAEELVGEGSAVMVVTSQLGGDPAHEVLENGVEVVRLPARLLMGDRLPISKKNAEYRRNLQHVREWAPDRVLVNARFYEHSVEGLKLAQELGAPAVVLDHGSSYLSLSNPAADAVLKGYEHAMTARDERLAPTFAGVSEKSAHWLSTFGIDTDLVVNNAIDAEAFRAGSSGRDFRNELGVDEDRLLVAFCGRLVREKHPELVAEAARLLPEAFFVVAGAGPQEDAVSQAAGELSNLAFVGKLASADVSALFAQSDGLLFPTEYPEGLPTVMLEAGAWGARPLMPADVAGVSDVLSGTGLLVPVESVDPVGTVEAVRRLQAEGPATRAEKAAELRAHIEQACTWQRTAAQLDAAFQVAEAGAGSVRP